jgi:hypothetical protein
MLKEEIENKVQLENGVKSTWFNLSNLSYETEITL